MNWQEWLFQPVFDKINEFSLLVVREFRTAVELIQLSRPRHTPFAAVIVEGVEQGPGSPFVAIPTTMSESRMLYNGEEYTFKFQPMRPMRDIRITLLCDLKEVNCEGIYYGTDLLTNGPVARVELCHVGVIIRVIVKPRDC